MVKHFGEKLKKFGEKSEKFGEISQKNGENTFRFVTFGFVSGNEWHFETLSDAV